MAEVLRLILMRHAKSSWKSGAPTDHARPLNKRGRRDAPRIGKALADRRWQPDLVLSSDSERTRETFERMREPLGGAPRVVFTRTLYHAGVEQVREALVGVSEGQRCVLLLGHNMGWEQVLTWLTGKEERMTTANAALMSCEIGSWEQAVQSPLMWSLNEVLRPKTLTE